MSRQITTNKGSTTITIQPPPCYEPENPCDSCAWRNSCKKYKGCKFVPWIPWYPWYPYPPYYDPNVTYTTTTTWSSSNASS